MDNSSNGIFLNGKVVNGKAVLHEKDVITILNSTLLYTDGNVFYKTSRQGTHIDVTDVNKYVGKNNKKIKIVSYIDGPFFPNKELTLKEQQKELRNKIYNCMDERSKNSNIEHIKYIKKVI